MAVDRAPALALHTKSQAEVVIRGLLHQGNGNLLDPNLMNDLVKERSTDSVTFSLRMSSMLILKSGTLTTKSEELIAVCHGLKVKFQNNGATYGELENSAKPVPCMLYI